jgi:hypothetical protein
MALLYCLAGLFGWLVKFMPERALTAVFLVVTAIISWGLLKRPKAGSLGPVNG